MEPFATVVDYTARYGPVTDEQALYECLVDATDLIVSELEASDISYTNQSESFTARLRRVCRSVARRAFGSDSGVSDVPFGATQLSETSDVFSASVQLGNPYGDLFLTEAERRSLGIGQMQVAVLNPYA